MIHFSDDTRDGFSTCGCAACEAVELVGGLLDTVDQVAQLLDGARKAQRVEHTRRLLQLELDEVQRLVDAASRAGSKCIVEAPRYIDHVCEVKTCSEASLRVSQDILEHPSSLGFSLVRSSTSFTLGVAPYMSDASSFTKSVSSNP